MSWVTILLLVFGGALAVEGLGWAVAPDGMRNAYDEMLRMLDPQRLSMIGLICFTLGILMIVAGIRMAA
ncbi:DUF2065 domain-containing protein [Algimonas porphyrae]|uniref:DUF2065 domain-containing protein n=1 Tax=Algimonas porphyrae TaxID=1128113 RepID=A0ABQ5UVK8_9PROT|nr:DUF2065 domain-containing protein [Algimonas porphyrae]GLQ19316.1 hypothetical protein GCM10007854_02710 [Algimonas porphyrae]